MIQTAVPRPLTTVGGYLKNNYAVEFWVLLLDRFTDSKSGSRAPQRSLSYLLSLNKSFLLILDRLDLIYLKIKDPD